MFTHFSCRVLDWMNNFHVRSGRFEGSGSFACVPRHKSHTQVLSSKLHVTCHNGYRITGRHTKYIESLMLSGSLWHSRFSKRSHCLERCSKDARKRLQNTRDNIPNRFYLNLLLLILLKIRRIYSGSVSVKNSSRYPAFFIVIFFLEYTHIYMFYYLCIETTKSG